MYRHVFKNTFALRHPPRLEAVLAWRNITVRQYKFENVRAFNLINRIREIDSEKARKYHVDCEGNI